MKTFDTHIDIEAPVGRVWEVIAEIGRWPEWTASVKRIEALDDGPPRVGARYRLHQLELLPAVWVITEWEPDRRFVWESGHPGLRSTGVHRIDETPSGSRLTLAVTYAGLLSGPVSFFARSLTQHFLHLESTGCKARSEGRI